MRAIIRASANISREQLKGILIESKWWPPLDQNDPEVVRHRNSIISLVADEDKQIVEATIWYMIFNNKLRTWGLINSPHVGDIEFRLKNQSSPQLQKACEELVAALQSKLGAGVNVSIEFTETIEVLEANSQHYAYYGDPLPDTHKGKWKLAKMERLSEWRLGGILFGCSLLLMLLTIPPSRLFFSQFLSYEWMEWGDGALGRLATSALVSSLVSYVGVLMHYFEIQRHGAIRWYLKKDAQGTRKAI